MKALAVDLGGSHATCALVGDQSVLVSKVVATDGSHGLEPVLPVLRETFVGLLSQSRMSASDGEGLAFSFCGIVDSSTQRILATNGKYDDGPSLDLVGWCRESFGITLKMANDARMALLGEWYAGAARGSNDVVMITLGTGMGGAAMVQGQLLWGKHFQAGCLGGHFPVQFNGRTCSCGAIGCAEAEASTVSLPGLCKSNPGYESSELARDEPVTFEKLFQYGQKGDHVAIEIRERCLQVWGAATVALIHAYDPELLVLGGGVMKSASVILPYLQNYIHRHAWTPWGKVKVCAAELGNDAALLGAIPLLRGLADR